MDIQSEYLMQYYLTSVPNPSDDSDFEADSINSYDLEEEIQITKLNKIAEEEIRQNERKQKAKQYVEKWRYSKFSIFNLPGIKFTHYTHTFIRILFKPAYFRFSKKSSNRVNIKNFMCIDRIYKITLIYKMKYNWWALGKNHVPCKDEVMELFKRNIYDEYLNEVICRIYEILMKYTKNLALERQKRKKAFLAGDDITLTPDEEILFLTEEEIENRRKRQNEFGQRRSLSANFHINEIISTNDSTPNENDNSVEARTEITETFSVSGMNTRKKRNLNYFFENTNSSHNSVQTYSVTSEEYDSSFYSTNYSFN